MPVYEYQCRACGERFDLKQSFSDEPIKVCPKCGGETRRVLHPPGIVFKGSGWYITDSRPSPSESEGGTSSQTADKGEKKESQPTGDAAAPSSESSGSTSRSSDGAAKAAE